MIEIPDFLIPGTKNHIGEHLFEPESIIRFAKKYDPQPFHIDAIAAKESLLGGLCASGWHTGSVWMALQRKHVAKNNQRLKDEGKPIAAFGPSPGMKYMKWLKPVFAGNTISFSNLVKEMRQSNSRPQWWLITTQSYGYNQNNAQVFELESTAFLQIKQG